MWEKAEGMPSSINSVGRHGERESLEGRKKKKKDNLGSLFFFKINFN